MKITHEIRSEITKGEGIDVRINIGAIAGDVDYEELYMPDGRPTRFHAQIQYIIARQLLIGAIGTLSFYGPIDSLLEQVRHISEEYEEHRRRFNIRGYDDKTPKQ